MRTRLTWTLNEGVDDGAEFSPRSRSKSRLKNCPLAGEEEDGGDGDDDDDDAKDSRCGLMMTLWSRTKQWTMEQSFHQEQEQEQPLIF